MQNAKKINDKETIQIIYTNVENLDLNLINRVPKFRQDKINQYVFDKDKKLSLGAWLLVQEIGDFDVAFTTMGKPYFTNSNIKFNISHSGSFCICAYSNYNIGCDIELIQDYEDELAKQCMLKDELKIINKNGKKFYDFWTMKESYIKALGKGLSINPLSFSAKAINDWYFYPFSINSNYSSCVCTDKKNLNINICELNKSCAKKWK